MNIDSVDMPVTRPDHVLCRARRLLNPFRGFLHTIVEANLDAATLDGVNWGLYLTDESIYRFMDLNSVAPFQSAEIKYGEWSESQGLKRAPLLPGMHTNNVELMGNQLLKLVEQESRHLPFELVDCYERWLLDDQTGEPLALLESAFGEQEITYNSNTRWKMGDRALRELKQQGEDARRLESAINSRGSLGNNAWFHRQSDTYGVRISRTGESSNHDNGTVTIELPLHGFSLHWDEPEIYRIAVQYLSWLSPWLLVMRQDQDKELERLVEDAVQYPQRLYSMRRFLGADIRERRDIKAALVSARLNASQIR
ncbi:MAG: hypothetical protein HUJ29_11700 [Gammaproteobacteria bacterium]|nr:hypothetical protein [Gammaproteobacteria bacterium]